MPARTLRRTVVFLSTFYSLHCSISIQSRFLNKRTPSNFSLVAFSPYCPRSVRFWSCVLVASSQLKPYKLDMPGQSAANHHLQFVVWLLAWYSSLIKRGLQRTSTWTQTSCKMAIFSTKRTIISLKYVLYDTPLRMLLVRKDALRSTECYTGMRPVAPLIGSRYGLKC